MPPSPTRSGPAAAASSALFGALSAVRGRRIVHPRGVGYEGELRIDLDEQPPGAPFLAPGSTYRTITRLSRSAGLPQPLPDVLGLALRALDAHGEGRHQDLLMVTSASGPGVRHLLLPARDGFFGQPFSSLLPYRVGRELLLVGALPVAPPERPGGRDVEELVELADTGPVVFRLALAPLSGGWRPAGTLRLGRRLPDDEVEQLRLNPWNTGGGLAPAGPFNGIRDAAYRGSQAARPA